MTLIQRLGKHLIWASALVGVAWAIAYGQSEYYNDPKVAAMEMCTRGIPNVEKQTTCANAIFGIEKNNGVKD